MKRKDLIQALDDLHSLYIRLIETDDHGWGNCYTCGRSVFYKEADCGHYVTSVHYAARWVRENTHLQCKECNQGKDGNVDVYEDELIEEYGIEMLDLLDTLKHTEWFPTNEWLEKKLEECRKSIKSIQRTKMVK